MKVKNIVFSGFAAAILMGVAADASAATQVATKAYVDRLEGTFPVAAGEYVSGVTQSEGFVGVTTAPLATQIADNVMTAPTTKAVFDYVTEANNLDQLNSTSTIADGEYVSSVVQSNGVVNVSKGNLATEIAPSVMKAPTTDAVNTAIAGVTSELDGEFPVTPGQYVSAVTQADGAVSVTTAALSPTISEGVMIAPTTDAVNTAIAGVTSELDGEFPVTPGQYVSAVTQADGAVTVTTSALATEIADEVMIAPTTDAVYEEIKNIPDPDNCQSALCVWTSQGWKDATSPLE